MFIRHIIDFTPDILCLQEVEASVFELFGASLYSLGYVGLFIQKAQDKPDEEQYGYWQIKHCCVDVLPVCLQGQSGLCAVTRMLHPVAKSWPGQSLDPIAVMARFGWLA